MGTDVLRPAVDAQLVEVGERISFRHPLIRSAAIHSATSAARRETHQALADVTDPERDPDRRAWHRAMAAAGPDEEVADELERSARRAQMRGGLAAAAAFLERAAELTAASGPRAARALAAADAHDRAGAQATALRLIAQAQTGPLDALQRARVHIVRGRIAFGSRHGRDAPPLLLAAARELEPLDPLAAREAYLDALAAALFVGRLAGEVGWAEVAHAARAAPASAGRPQDLLLDGLVVALTEGLAAGAPVLKVAVAAFQTADLPPAQAVRWLWLAAHAAHDLWDVASWAELSTRRVALARETGSLATLPLALNNRIALHLFAGELSTAASVVDEIAAITEATGSGRPPYSALTLAAFRGRDAEATGLLHVVEPEVVARGDGMALTLVHHAKAVLANGLGHYREACEAARRGAADTRELGFSSWSLPQLVEAAVRSDQPDLAEDALRRLRRTTRPSGTDWALGIEARCRALVSAEAEAEACYRDAIDSLTRTPLRAELARCHLLYGEWLRRAGRRVDARTQLRLAHEMFTDMGMEGFAERSRHERLATGETVRRRTVETSLDLTPQEAQIAQLARAGRTNADIGAQLFLSPRNGRMASEEGVRQARDHLAQRTARRVAGPVRVGAPPIGRSTSPANVPLRARRGASLTSATPRRVLVDLVCAEYPVTVLEQHGSRSRPRHHRGDKSQHDRPMWPSDQRVDRQPVREGAPGDTVRRMLDADAAKDCHGTREGGSQGRRRGRTEAATAAVGDRSGRRSGSAG
jgi:hypothetical protein